MVRAIVLFEGEVEPERYQRHVDEFATKVEYSAFRNGKIFGSPFGEPKFRHYAEFEWNDKESFNAAVNSPEFAAAGKDAMEMGIPFNVHFAEIE